MTKQHEISQSNSHTIGSFLGSQPTFTITISTHNWRGSFEWKLDPSVVTKSHYNLQHPSTRCCTEGSPALVLKSDAFKDLSHQVLSHPISSLLCGINGHYL